MGTENKQQISINIYEYFGCNLTNCKEQDLDPDGSRPKLDKELKKTIKINVESKSAQNILLNEWLLVYTEDANYLKSEVVHRTSSPKTEKKII